MSASTPDRTAPTWRHHGEHCLHGPQAHDAAQVSLRLQQAEQRCQQQGGRMSPARRAVLQAILQADRPLGAYEVLARLSADQGRPVGPPTVYRALDFLMAQGLVHRLSSLNAFVSCCHFRERHEAVFLICECCHRVREATPQSVFGPLETLVQHGGFVPRTALIEMLGRCVDCAFLSDSPTASAHEVDA